MIYKMQKSKDQTTKPCLSEAIMSYIKKHGFYCHLACPNYSRFREGVLPEMEQKFMMGSKSYFSKARRALSGLEKMRVSRKIVQGAPTIFYLSGEKEKAYSSFMKKWNGGIVCDK